MELLLVLVLVSDMAARFRRLCPNSEYKGRPIPVAIRNWIKKPVVDMELGKKIVVELASKGGKCYDSMV